jgi:formate dehydrogenase accessory protein FdhE
MAVSPWQQRIRRAQELIPEHPYAREILEFYIHIARFQETLHGNLKTALQSPAASLSRELSMDELAQLGPRFDSFLALTANHGPRASSELSQELRARGESFWGDLLSAHWSAASASDAQGLLAWTFLQPYAELVRSRDAPSKATQTTRGICPFCNRKPATGVLRQMGDGAARSLICSFCLAEWEFRRLVCPACGEQNDRNLPVFTASDIDYIRIECCDTCKTYLKTVDLTKNGRADPIVDELASTPLDLWVQERGYMKLQKNFLGM